MTVQPTWLLVLSWAAVIMGLASAAFIVVDHYVRGYRQPVKVMELIWPVTALYFGPAAVIAYRNWGRPQSHRWRERYGNPPERPARAVIVIELCHRSAHCTLGTVIATVAIYAFGIGIASNTLWPDYIGAYLAVVAVGIAFRYSTEAYTGGLRARAAIRTFFKADLLSVSVFEFTLFIWLALLDHIVFRGAPAA